MSFYAISHNAEHASTPVVCWRVEICSVTARAEASLHDELHYLFVPQPDRWMLDTVRMTLRELAAFLPSDDNAVAGVTAKMQRAGKPRKDGTVRPARFDQYSVELWVEARGWRAYVRCWHDDRPALAANEPEPVVNDWTEPMQATLLDLAAKSPFLLRNVQRVSPEFDAWRYPARQDVIAGELPNYVERRSRQTDALSQDDD